MIGERHDSQTGGNLLHNLVLFGRLLRRLGLDVNPGRVIDLVRALEHVEIGNRADFYHTLRTLLVHHRDQIPIFDRAFELFWRKRGVDLEGLAFPDWSTQKKEEDKPLVIPPPLNEQSEEVMEAAEDEEEQLVLEVTQTFSRHERLRRKDFGALTPEEVETMKRFMAELVWQLGQRQTRRFQSGRGSQLDLRRSFRRNLRYGGEILEWPRKERKVKPRPLVVIADISGSMERYTRLLLQFIYSLAEGLSQEVEAFVFGTRLTRVTRELRGRELDRALQTVSQKVTDWSGGTRIGDALKSFNFRWGRRVLGRGAVVILISDGWDRGDPDLLNAEMARLQRHCYRLIWLNPLLGSTRYEPLTRGMMAALPYIDDFLPVHNLASLEDLAQHLAQLDERRSVRPRIETKGAAFLGKPR